MTRAKIIKNCVYPALPKNMLSIHQLYHVNLSTKQSDLWLGGGFTKSINSSSFLLSSQYHKVKCVLSNTCLFFFNFDKKSIPISKSKIFSFLKKGDHLLVYIDNKIQKINRSTPLWEITNITKVTVVSVNKTSNKIPVYSSTVDEQQKKWFLFLQTVHAGMKKLCLEQMETPSLVDCPGTEPHLSVFKTTLLKGSTKKQIFLSTSPEMHLKRLLCYGFTDIYEIKKCFRNQESGPINHREFYMLEWYRAYSKLSVLIQDIQFLFNFLSDKINCKKIMPIKQISMRALFKQHVNMILHPQSSAQDFIQSLKKHNIPFEGYNDIDDLFYLLFLNKIEPQLDFETPTFIYDYPVFQKAYARINAQGWASRFELFWRGMELANAFDEVINPQEQKERFLEDNIKRKHYKKQTIPFYDKLLEDMKMGMPPSAGVALGLDRLFLAFYNLTDIKNIRFFSV